MINFGFSRAGVRQWAGFGLALLLSSACATTTVRPTSSGPDPSSVRQISDDTDVEGLTALMSQMSHDLHKLVTREKERITKLAGPVTKNMRERMKAETRISSEVILSNLTIPVAGLTYRDLYDSWGQPRDGGKRSHKGIDIFAPKGREIIAVADGYLSYIGTQPKGGKCLWLVTDAGISFYYAHLDRWAAGIYEGMEVKRGDLLGYVGNTGNAITTPPHLHFGVVENDEAINPYPLFRGAVVTVRGSGGSGTLGGGFGRGSGGK